MSHPLTLHSEAYSAAGNLAADGYLKLLGAPSIDILQTLVREAVQNSCDAALRNGGFEVHFRLRSLDGAQRAVLRERVFADPPRGSAAAEALGAFLDAPDARVLEICDFGTGGLRGPTRADVAVENGQPTDFVDFLRNVGSRRNTAHGGGTYGYGKASLYLASRCSAILVDSQTTDLEGAPVRRVMAAQLGSAFEADDTAGVRRRFTGRHWWGLPGVSADLVEPVEGDDAAALATAVGLSDRDPGRSGTSIMILDPRFADVDGDGVVRTIEEALLWYFWPRLIDGTPDDRRIHFRVFVDGAERSLPRPEDFPPLDLFARAMRGLRSDPPDGEDVCSYRPARLLGRLNIVKGMRGQRIAAAKQDGSIIPARSAAIAVMRPVELVVRYYNGTHLADDRLEWAGVFVTSNDEAVEAAFAKAEPPAHDDWQFEALADRTERQIVRIGVNRIRQAASEFANPVSSGPAGSDDSPSLAGVAGLFGRLLEGNGEGAGPRRPSGGGGSSGSGSGRSGGPTVSRPVFVGLEMFDGVAVAVFELTVRGDGTPVELVLEPALVMDGGAAAGPTVAPPPRIVSVRNEMADEIGGSSRAGLGNRDGRFEVRIAMPADCAVTLGVRLDARGAA